MEKRLGFSWALVCTALVVVVLTVGCGREADVGVPIVFDSVPANQERLLRGDFAVLGSLPAGTGNTRVLDVPVFEGREFTKWLRERVKYIVGTGFDFARNLPEPEGSRFPDGSLGEELASVPMTNIFMGNLGAMLYRIGRDTSQVTYQIRIGGRIVRATTPRTGIDWIGDALFREYHTVGTTPEAFSNSLVRLSTVLHEARHSDGSGDGAGFGHVRCVESWRRPVCDDTANGPNAIEAEFMTYALTACANCTNPEKETFRGIIAEARSRVIPRSPFRNVTPVVAL